MGEILSSENSVFSEKLLSVMKKLPKLSTVPYCTSNGSTIDEKPIGKTS